MCTPARCGHCVHEKCKCMPYERMTHRVTGPASHPQRYGEAVGYVYMHAVRPTPPPPMQLCKRTNYPRSFSLTPSQYQAVLAGRFGGITVFDAFTGAFKACFDQLTLIALTRQAEAKHPYNGGLYYVVRW